MVMGCARRTTGDRELAQEVAQNVFTVLARKATRLNPEIPLGAWLHRATLFEASRARRKESLRNKKMTEFAEQMDIEPQDRLDSWHEIVPLIDEAVDRLSRNDRQVVILRFFEGRTYQDIGDRLGKSDEAIRKRVSRALVKLAGILGRAGVAISVTALATELNGRVFDVVSNNELVATISANAVSSVASPMSATATAMGIQKMLVAVTTVAVALPMAVLWVVNRSYAQEVDRLQGGTQRPALTNSGASAPEATALPAGSHADASNGEPKGIDLRQLQAQLSQLEQRPHEMKPLFQTLALVYQLSRDQLSAAFEMFQASSLADSHIYVHEALFTRWAQFAPQEAMLRSKEVREHSARLAAIEGVIKKWVTHESEAALAALEDLEMDSHQKEWIRGPVVSALVAHDPHEALARLRSASGESRSSLLHTLSWNWTRQDPVAALSWVAELEVKDQEEVFPKVLNELAMKDPNLVLETVLDMETLNDRDLQGLFRGWVRRDLQGAIDALTELPEELRTDMVVEPFCFACSDSPAKDVLALAKHIPDPNVANKLLSLSAVSKDRDIQGALQLLEQVSECRWREQAVAGITNNWFKQDPLAVETWLLALPPSPSRDSGAATMTRELERTNPRKASAWALRIEHPETRTRWLMSAVRAWVRQDRNAATEWLENAQGLSKEEQQNLRNLR